MPSYKYVVTERTFKENRVMGAGEEFVSTEVYVSRALQPADEVTKVAVAKLKVEHDAFYKKAAPISAEEAGALRKLVEEQAAQLAEALGALKQAAASARK